MQSLPFFGVLLALPFSSGKKAMTGGEESSKAKVDASSKKSKTQETEQKKVIYFLQSSLTSSLIQHLFVINHIFFFDRIEKEKELPLLTFLEENKAK
jgi:hypothetical protein